jgi:ribonuclease HI
MCLNNESWSLFRITSNIQHSAESFKLSFQKDGSCNNQNRVVKWNCNNHMGSILNVDGSCLGTPIRAGFGGIIRNTHGFFLSGFSGYISSSSDILFAELTAIYRGLRMAIDMGLDDLICYSDSLLSVNLINGNTPSYHTYAVLIQDIKDMLQDSNFTLHHTLREGNHCADFMAKLGASSADDFTMHSSPPADLLPLLKTDASGTLFSRP